MAGDKELAGKVALVTGASRNIGRGIALALGDAGAAVAVNTRASREDAGNVVQEIRAAGGRSELYLADITEVGAVKAMVEAIVERFGRLDILVLNAAVRGEKPFTELTYEEWRLPLSISLDGAFFCAQACLPHMLAAGGGSIVTLGGQVALAGGKNRVHGSVAKHGLVGITRGLAREFGDRGIRVNCVSPGIMNTARAAGRASPPEAAGAVPLGRAGEGGEVAAAVRFLCGPGAAFISGQTLHVNGGQMMF